MQSLHVCFAHNFLLSSTQSAAASRDANILQLEERCEQLKERCEQLEEKCEQLTAQVSLPLCVWSVLQWVYHHTKTEKYVDLSVLEN